MPLTGRFFVGVDSRLAETCLVERRYDCQSQAKSGRFRVLSLNARSGVSQTNTRSIR